MQLPTNPLQCLQGQHPVCLILGATWTYPLTSYILFFLCSNLPQNLQKFPSKPPMVVITTNQPLLRCAFNTFCCNTLGSCAPRTKFSATAPVRSCSWRHLPGKGNPPSLFYLADFEVENKTWWWQVSVYHEGRVLYSPSIIFLVGNPTHSRVLTCNDPPAKHFMARYLQLRDIVALFEQRLSWENNHLNKGCAGCWGQPWLSLFKPATHIRPRLSLCHSNDDIVCNIQHLKISTWHLEVSTSHQYSAREHLTAWTCCGLFWEH